MRQQLEVTDRKDKTGSRTFPGIPPGGRLRTEFELRSYMTSWAAGEGQPSHGPLFQASLGGTPAAFAGGTVASATAGGRVTLQAAHGLAAGQGVTCGGELRFVNAVVDAATVQLNAPFAAVPEAGMTLGPTMTYTPATELASVSVFDYWSPGTAVQRLLRGAAVDTLKIVVNGDFHEFQFGGIAQDVLDTSSFSGEAGALDSFPAEPALAAFDYSVVPGNMGQAWLGDGGVAVLHDHERADRGEERFGHANARIWVGRGCRGRSRRGAAR